MSASFEPDDDTDLVARAARKAYEGAGGNITEATRRLEQAVRASRKLRDDLTEPLLSTACYDAVRVQCRAARHRVWSPSARALAQHRSDSHRRAVTTARARLLDFPLPGGLALGSATRVQVIGAAEAYERQAGDMAWKARWLAMVASALPEGRKVREALTEARLRKMQSEASDD